MLELKKINKYYKMGDKDFQALKNVSLKFRKGEFVAILGPSGCGKTTTLNIIGGLDRYSDGDLVINGTSTKDFKEREWDSYRNNSVGFVFQSYNLISHLTVLDNVELGMTLSGVGQTERKEKALAVLKRVGLETQVNKKPTKLSGGEKQRVAIARALVNDPDIILADEPTGALDSKTAHEILTLIKEISKDELVIMVTHAPKYAKAYASRTIKLLDGEVIEDDDKFDGEETLEEGYKPKKTSMDFFTALKLSFNNLKTKKFRTIITALASSIGIIGVGLVLSISNGFSQQIDDLESDQLVGFPIMISTEESELQFGRIQVNNEPDVTPEENELVVYDSEENVHKNIVSAEFMDYLADMPDSIYTSLHYEYGYFPILLHDVNGTTELLPQFQVGFNSFITPEEDLEEYYTVVAGRLPNNVYELVFVAADNDVIDKKVVEALGLDPEQKVYYEDILGMEFYVARNNDLYNEQAGFYIQNFGDLDGVLSNGIKLEIVGILHQKDDTVSLGSSEGIFHLYGLEEIMINANVTSDICVAQDATTTSVIEGNSLNDDELRQLLSYLGCNNDDPYLVQIYSDSIENKDAIKDYIADYNKGKDADDQIVEIDLAETIGETLGTIITSISAVLSAFASISLVVSSVMIGIIIYVSVLERTKEIGIIRSLGGRKKDISRVFNAESIIIGAFAGIMGVTITWILTFPINIIAERVEPSLVNVAQVNVLHLALLVVLSTFLTFIGGFIPSRIAASKNPVEALRVE